LEAADRAVSEYGGQVSVAVIAAEAGVTKPVLYRHFGDKAGLYRALAELHTEDLLAQLRAALMTRGGLRKRVAATIDAYLAAIERRPDVYRFVVQQAAVEEPAVAGYVALVQQRLAAELAAGLRLQLALPATALRAEVWAHGIVGMVRAAGDWWLEHRDITREALVSELTELLMGELGEVTPAAARAADARGAAHGAASAT
jgi:AcrR family transcriptional regulator